VVHRLHNQRKALRPVVAPARDEPDANRISAGHEAVAVVFDLVNPIGAGRRAIGGGREAGLDKTGGHCPVYFRWSGRGVEWPTPVRAARVCQHPGGPFHFSLEAIEGVRCEVPLIIDLLN
jgi:hypothetical protein